VSTSPVRSPKRAQESSFSLIENLHDDVHRNEVWVGEVTIVVTTKFCLNVLTVKVMARLTFYSECQWMLGG